MKTLSKKEKNKIFDSNAADYLHLKWGKFKSGRFSDPEMQRLLKEYNNAPDDSVLERELLCEMIDKIDGPISIWWTSEENVSKGKAKKYVREYGE